jgi:hypothetical protein
MEVGRTGVGQRSSINHPIITYSADSRQYCLTHYALTIRNVGKITAVEIIRIDDYCDELLLRM